MECILMGGASDVMCVRTCVCVGQTDTEAETGRENVPAMQRPPQCTAGEYMPAARQHRQGQVWASSGAAGFISVLCLIGVACMMPSVGPT